jgi:hypothetical protein
VAALRLMWRAELRRRGRGWLGLALGCGVLLGVALTAAVAARRADTAAHRYSASTHEADAWVLSYTLAGRPGVDLGAAAHLPQVVSSARFTAAAPLGLVTDSGRVIHYSDFALFVPERGYGRTVDRPKLVSGRLPSPSRPDEVLVDKLMADSLHVGPGSRLRIRLMSPAEARMVTTDQAALERMNPLTDGEAPLVSVRVSGVDAMLLQSNVYGNVRAGPGFAAEWGRRLTGLVADVAAVRLRHGEADVPALQREVARLYPPPRAVFVFALRPAEQDVVDTIALQGGAMWLLAAAAAIAALLFAGQAVGRRTVEACAGQPLWHALGASRRTLVAAAMCAPALAAVVATAVAAGIAVAASPLTRVGIAGVYDPAGGFLVEPRVLLVGGLACFAALLVVPLLVGWRAATRTQAAPVSVRMRRGPRRTLADAAERLGAAPWLRAGMLMTFDAGGDRRPAAQRATLVLLAALFAVLACTVVVAASALRVLDTPRLYGQNFALLGAVGETTPGAIDATFRSLRRDPRIATATAAALAEVSIDGKPGDLLGVRAISRLTPFSVASGRAPEGAGEIALGAGTAARLHAGIGDIVTVTGTGRTARLRVSGRVVLPDEAWGTGSVGLGDGALLPLATLERLVPHTPVSRLLVQLRSGVPPERGLAALRRETRTDWSIQAVPTQVTRIRHVRWIPYLLVGTVALAALGALLNLLLSSVRRRRRELAILKTLGLTRADLGAAVGVHSTVATLAGLVVGAPLGIIAGRWIWNLLAARMGVLPEPVTPPLLALLVPGALILCLLVASPAALLASRTRAAVVLRGE